MNILTTKISNKKISKKELLAYSFTRQAMFHPKSDMQINGKTLVSLRKSYADTLPKQLATYLKDILDEEIITVSHLTVKSTFHTLFLVETKNKAYVVKLNVLQKRHKDFSFLLEETIQEKLHNNNMPYVWTFADISRITAPYDFLVMEYIQGDNMESYSDTNTRELYKKFGTLLKKIHTFPMQKAGTIDYSALIGKKLLQGSFPNWSKFFTVRLAEHIQQSIALGFLSKDEGIDVGNIFNQLNPRLQNISLSLLHNDLSPRNIFTNGKEIVGILDWEDAIIGDPLWEIAFIDTFLFSEKDRIKFDAFCEGYGVSKKHISVSPLYWMYCLRNTMVKAISRNREGYYNTRGFEIDKQRISSSLMHLKKVTK